MLTGKTRYRINLMRKMILQVEFLGAKESGLSYPSLGLEWRDATLQDYVDIESGRFTEFPPPRPPEPKGPPPTPRQTHQTKVIFEKNGKRYEDDPRKKPGIGGWTDQLKELKRAAKR